VKHLTYGWNSLILDSTIGSATSKMQVWVTINQGNGLEWHIELAISCPIGFWWKWESTSVDNHSTACYQSWTHNQDQCVAEILSDANHGCYLQWQWYWFTGLEWLPYRGQSIFCWQNPTRCGQWWNTWWRQKNYTWHVWQHLSTSEIVLPGGSGDLEDTQFAHFTKLL
jgi:hypothetical protein